MDEAKPFKIPKREVWEAFKRVRANQGTAGVDGQSIAEFEANLSGNLYKLWNRMSSGSYFPPPVLRVDIPKADGGTRPLGIPTVADRVAQEVARRYLEPILEPVFHADSYGYRPGRSAIDAVGRARERCWRHDWVLDLDIKGFFDSIDSPDVSIAQPHKTTRQHVQVVIAEAIVATAALSISDDFISAACVASHAPYQLAWPSRPRLGAFSGALGRTLLHEAGCLGRQVNSPAAVTLYA